jgi:glycosyltransferase involved in cell wall biosynthesis
MHVLFVHQNFPAQFGHIAQHLIKQHGFRCTFASEKRPGEVAGIERIQYRCSGGANAQTNVCSRPFENQMWHSQALFDALSSRPDIQPDLVVGHSGFVSTLFLRELYECPIVNYFEYFYRTHGTDMDFRSDLPGASKQDLIRARARNAILLLDLQNCDVGYSPTQFQRQQMPPEYQPKLSTIFDGIDTDIWRPIDKPVRRVASWTIPPGQRIVTYVNRGLESMRGFDIFMRVAKRVCDMRDDVTFVVVGEDRIVYGGDARFTQGKTFKQWVLAQDSYDLSRILFVGRLAPHELAELFSLTDLHIYLTVPFVLSWSLMNALACGAIVLASDTAPVREMVMHQQNGLLCDFFDVDKMLKWVNDVLDNTSDYKKLGAAGVEMIAERYSLAKCLPQMVELYQRALNRSGG